MTTPKKKSTFILETDYITSIPHWFEVQALLHELPLQYLQGAARGSQVVCTKHMI